MFTLQTPAPEIIAIAREAIHRKVTTPEDFFHPARSGFTDEEMAVFVGLFETCGLTEDQATRAAAVAVALVDKHRDDL